MSFISRIFGKHQPETQIEQAQDRLPVWIQTLRSDIARIQQMIDGVHTPVPSSTTALPDSHFFTNPDIVEE